MKGLRPRDFNVGDWVRFYRDGRLVVGVVQYIDNGPYDVRDPYARSLETDNGSVSTYDVLERR